MPKNMIMADAMANEATMTISAGASSSFVVLPDGSLWAWGDNEFGQLGDGTTTDSYNPIKIMDEVIAISANSAHAMAIRVDGSLWAWGSNEHGQLGNGATADHYSPIKIMDDVITVSAGELHAMAIRTDGSLWAWGHNGSGQLGDGTRVDRYTPVKIMEDVFAVSAGGSHTMAIKTDGSLWAWGSNDSGQLGDGSPNFHDCASGNDFFSAIQYRPVKIMEDVVAVSAGHGNTMAIRDDGSLWAWGSNQFGAYMAGVIRVRNTPVKIMEDVVAISAGVTNPMAVQSDGSLWIWGINEEPGFWSSGATTIDYLTPVKVLDDVIAVSAGTFWRFESHRLAIKTDGSLWAWGDNNWGQLGHNLGLGLSDSEKPWEERREIQAILNEPKKIMDNVMLPGNILSDHKQTQRIEAFLTSLAAHFSQH